MRFKRRGTYVRLWLIHTVVWQKPIQHCKAIILQFKKNHCTHTILWAMLGPGFPAGTVIKNSPANAGDERDAGSVPGRRRSPGGGNGNPLQYSRPGKPTDRGAWRATVHGVARVRHDWETEQTYWIPERAHSPSLRRTKVQFSRAKIIYTAT